MHAVKAYSFLNRISVCVFSCGNENIYHKLCSSSSLCCCAPQTSNACLFSSRDICQMLAGYYIMISLKRAAGRGETQLSTHTKICFWREDFLPLRLKLSSCGRRRRRGVLGRRSTSSKKTERISFSLFHSHGFSSILFDISCLPGISIHGQIHRLSPLSAFPLTVSELSL